ncbi:PREDICTED: uncharacterized protein LOC104799346 [Tarenaya hassleriana]|uniref:uncharacterized protein LOC104799346 n=1 Tax=Tarenaya hassleriana TaxID=28532 RepID=UPI00053C699C|nr:PREDICTED: uncharacterized protein LOC104799346 [Tarenaya hassleriana]
MKGSKATLSSLAEKCKSILVSNWQGYLNTIKSEAKSSAIHTSKVNYVIKRGKPYLWVPESESHCWNLMVDGRGSFSIARPVPGPLVPLLKSMNKLPMRVALTGDIVPVKEGKVESVKKYLEEIIQSEKIAISETTYAVQSLLDSSNNTYASRCGALKGILDEGKENYLIYKFTPSSCMFIDPSGSTKEIDMEDMERSKADPLAVWSTKLVDGINRSEARRRALILFCLYYLNTNTRDVYMMSIDKKGFDLLGKVPCQEAEGEYQWREFRFTFKEEAHDVEAFCRQLMEMEEEVVKQFTSGSGLGI